MTYETPSRFCPKQCGFVKNKDLSCVTDGNCWHLADKEVKPFRQRLEYGNGRVDIVTVIGENGVFDPIWYLLDGGNISKRNPWQR